MNGHNQGEVDIKLPAGLAAILQEYLVRTDNLDCSDAVAFKIKTPSRVRKRLGNADEDRLKRVICASERILLNAGNDAAFNQLQAAVARPVQLVWQDPNAQAAQLIVQNFGRNNAPTLRLTPNQQATALAGLAFAIGVLFFDATAKGLILAADNILSSVSLLFDQPESTCAARPMVCFPCPTEG